MFKGRFPDYSCDSEEIQSRILCYPMNSNYFEKTPITDMVVETMDVDGSSSPEIAMRSDVYLLMNQKRLDRLSHQALLDYFGNLPPSSPVSRLKVGMTDEQLAMFVKSRFIQAPSELMQWSAYLESQYPDIPKLDDSNLGTGSDSGGSDSGDSDSGDSDFGGSDAGGAL